MNYPEALHFIGKCLSLKQHPEHRTSVQESITNGNVEWERIVQVSSGALVLPALYIRLKDARLLDKLPTDLCDYMAYLTDKNRKRNRQILDQVQAITKHCNELGYAPTYLKGVAHLLTGLYDDIAERMIGDIDFLVSPDEMEAVAEILMQHGYSPLVEYNKDIHLEGKHYPRLQHSDFLAAVEVHREVLRPPYHTDFPNDLILKRKARLGSQDISYVPSTEDLLIHNALNVQINDKAYNNYNVHLRHMYDLSLLSAQKNLSDAYSNFGKFRRQINSWVAVSSWVLGKTYEFNHEKDKASRRYLQRFVFFINHPKLHTYFKIFIWAGWRLGRYIGLPLKAIFNKNVRRGLYARLSDLKWYSNHFSSYKSTLKH